jgi:hypothetical protein
MKDEYRVETNKDVYPENNGIDCHANCGIYTNEYVQWLEDKLKKQPTKKEKK